MLPVGDEMPHVRREYDTVQVQLIDEHCVRRGRTFRHLRAPSLQIARKERPLSVALLLDQHLRPAGQVDVKRRVELDVFASGFKVEPVRPQKREEPGRAVRRGGGQTFRRERAANGAVAIRPAGDQRREPVGPIDERFAAPYGAVPGKTRLRQLGSLTRVSSAKSGHAVRFGRDLARVCPKMSRPGVHGHDVSNSVTRSRASSGEQGGTVHLLPMFSCREALTACPDLLRRTARCAPEQSPQCSR